jgi:hypothetical protein
MSDNLRFLVSAGHDEYQFFLQDPNGRTVDEQKLELVWAYDYGDDDDDVVYDDDWMERLREQFRQTVGEEPGDWDLGWEHIYRIDAPRAEIEDALTELLATLDTEPGGDDDTFDYWPSGIRLAFGVAEKLSRDWPHRVEAVARRIITECRPMYAEELLAKVGLE